MNEKVKINLLNELKEFVKKMRDAQKKYFRTRDNDDLLLSKALEKKVDKIIFTLDMDGAIIEQDMFDMSNK